MKNIIRNNIKMLRLYGVNLGIECFRSICFRGLFKGCWNINLKFMFLVKKKGQNSCSCFKMKENRYLRGKSNIIR